MENMSETATTQPKIRKQPKVSNGSSKHLENPDPGDGFQPTLKQKCVLGQTKWISHSIPKHMDEPFKKA